MKKFTDDDARRLGKELGEKLSDVYKARRKRFLLRIIATLVAIPVVIVISYYGWQLQRWFHWKFAYGADTRTAICQMVKHEYLTHPEDCNER